MGTPPKWIIRRGIVIISLVVLLLLTGSYFYKYPDIIEARVTILSENPPIPVIARSDGKLDHIFVEDRQEVEANTILGIIENPADYQDVYALINILNSVQEFFNEPEEFRDMEIESEFRLGLYHSYYSTFISQLKDYQTYLVHNPFDQRIQSLNKQMEDYQTYFEKSRLEIAVLRQNYEVAHSQFVRDSALNKSGVRSDVELEKSKTAMLEQKYAYQSAQTNLASTRITTNNLKNQVSEQRVSKIETEKRLLAGLKEKYDNLLNQLRSWEQLFILKTPVKGRVTFTKIWSANQFVSGGNVVMTVVPSGEQNIIGKARIPVVGAGKVQVGQRVNMKLDNYPYMEYGFLEGKINNISMVPVQEQGDVYYTAEVELINRLNTNYNRELPFSQEMQGAAEVITKDRRLIERLVEPLVSIFREKI